LEHYEKQAENKSYIMVDRKSLTWLLQHSCCEVSLILWRLAVPEAQESITGWPPNPPADLTAWEPQPMAAALWDHQDQHRRNTRNHRITESQN